MWVNIPYVVCLGFAWAFQTYTLWLPRSPRFLSKTKAAVVATMQPTRPEIIRAAPAYRALERRRRLGDASDLRKMNWAMKKGPLQLGDEELASLLWWLFRKPWSKDLVIKQEGLLGKYRRPLFFCGSIIWSKRSNNSAIVTFLWWCNRVPWNGCWWPPAIGDIKVMNWITWIKTNQMFASLAMRFLIWINWLEACLSFQSLCTSFY